MSSPFKNTTFRIACLLAILLSIAFYDVVFLGKTFKVSTAVSQSMPYGVYGQADNKPEFIPLPQVDSAVLEEPLFQFIKTNLRKGILPLWNPHQACGFPLITMIEVGMFYPLNWITYIFPSWIAWDLLILSRLFLAGLFTFFFMRALRFKKLPSLAAGMTFMLSGPLVTLQFWTMNVDILTPLLLLMLYRLFQQPGNRRAAQLGLVTALTIFAGHPEHIILIHLYGLAFFVFLLCSSANEENFKPAVIALLKGYGLGAGLAAIALIPFIINFSTEFWHGHPPGVGLITEQLTERWITIFLPRFFQLTPLTRDWTPAGWWGGYLGLIPAGLGLLGVLSKQKRGINFFFGGMFLLLIGKDYAWPLINQLGNLPILNNFRFSFHTPPFTAFTLAVATGMGLRHVLTKKRSLPVFLAFTIGLSVFILFEFLRSRSAEHAGHALAAVGLAALFLVLANVLLFIKDKRLLPRSFLALLMTALLFSELFVYIYRERPRRYDSFPKVPYLEFIKQHPQRGRVYGWYWTLFPNTATAYQTDDLGIFMGLIMDRFVQYVNHYVRPGTFVSDLRPTTLRSAPLAGPKEFLDLLSLRYYVVPLDRRVPKVLFKQHRLKKIYEKEVVVLERQDAFPRAFIVHRVLFQPKDKHSIKTLFPWMKDLRKVAVIHAPPQQHILSALNQVPINDNSSASIVSYQANEVIVRAQMKNAGFLILSDSYHPAWKVTVNGQKTKLFEADIFLRAVFLPQGEHDVRFVFSPMSFWVGMWISILSTLFAILMFQRRKDAQAPRKRKNKKSRPGSLVA